MNPKALSAWFKWLSKYISSTHLLHKIAPFFDEKADCHNSGIDEADGSENVFFSKPYFRVS